MRLSDCKYFFYQFWDSFYSKWSDNKDIINEEAMEQFLFNTSDTSELPKKALSLEDANLVIYAYSKNDEAIDKLKQLKKKKNIIIIQWTGEAGIVDPNFEFTDLLLGSNTNDDIKNIYSFLSLTYLKCMLTFQPSLKTFLSNTNERLFCTTSCSYFSYPRYEVYDMINNYKLVDAFGNAFGKRLYGNYWDIDYIQCLSKYKFVICCENTYRDGYNTEKIINPILAGSIPIYWGADTVFNFVRKERILYLKHNCENLGEIIKQIVEIDNNDSLFKSIVAEQPFIYPSMEEVEQKINGTLNHNRTILEKLILNTKPIQHKVTVTPNNSSLNKLRIPVFLINLDRSIDRLIAMVRQFGKYDIDFTRIKGVDGNNLLADNFNFKIIGEVQETKLGAIGCTLSHLKAIKIAKDIGHSKVIIMEDDTDISLMEKWENDISYETICDNAPKDWEIIQMYTSNMNFIRTCYRNDRSNANQYVIRDDQAWSTGTYIINHKGIEKTLSKYYDANNDTFIISGQITADVLIYNGLVTYVYTTPTVCTMDDTFISIISPHKHDEHGINSSRYIREYYN
jgi:GR25 family glycosyltransferase involved in LPS biosynthesis